MRIKAISPDNQREITQVTALFRSVFGPSYPIKRVYDPSYWSGHIGAHFTSLAAVVDGEVVGHLSLQPDLYDPRLVHLGFPLIHPLAVGQLKEIGAAAMRVIESIAARQSWTAISYVEFPHISEMCRFGREVLGTAPVALLKGYFPAPTARLRGARLSRAVRRELKEFRRDIVVTQRAIGSRELERPLSVPAELLDAARSLCRRCGVVELETGRAPGAPLPLPADREAIEVEYFPQSRVVHLLIEPALAGTPQSVLAKLDSYDAASQHLFLNALDSGTPEFSHWLTNRGFTFAGMVPFYRGRVNLVLSRSALPSLQNEHRLDEKMRELYSILANGGTPAPARAEETAQGGARGTRRPS